MTMEKMPMPPTQAVEKASSHKMRFLYPLAAVCLAALPAGLALCGSLTTHHHRDHSGGNA